MTEFEYDTFLSHSTTDKPTVRRIAEALRDRGLRVWLDEDEIGLGDHIYSKIEHGIEHSRVLIFFASKHSLGSDWARIERSTAAFRDPINTARRFLIVRLDETPLPEVISGFLNLTWPSLEEAQTSSIDHLVSACLNKNTATPKVISYHDLFTPGAPPTKTDLLVGRDENIEELLDYLRSPGVHPIVVGDRGIGKTSLVRAAIEKSGASARSIIELNTVSSFKECCGLILGDLGLGLPPDDLSPASMLRALKKFDGLGVVSIDEMDDLPSGSKIIEALAKFAKAASNQSSDLSVKFIFSGISDDAQDIFQGHLSSDRNLPAITLQELTEDDLALFLERAGELLGASLSRHAVDFIVTEADGYPYFVHQVAFHTYAAFDQSGGKGSIMESHLTDGRKRAFQAAFSHYLRRYKNTVYRLSDLEIQILQYFLKSHRRRISVEEVKTTVARTAGEDEETVRSTMWGLSKKQYLRWRQGDKTLALKDGLLSPFLRDRLAPRLLRTHARRKKSTPNTQLDMF